MIEHVDSESRTTDDDHLSIRVWLRLLACTNLIESAISTRLREEFATTLPRFDFLSQLQRVPRGLRMSEISGRMMVTPGNITRIADQLEADALIARTPGAGDRRTSVVRLTPAGRRAFAEMARAHEAWIVGMFGALSERRRTDLHEVLAVLKRHLTTTKDEA